MLSIYRLDVPDAVARNPYSARQPRTRRAPGNVPYIVDNLWEWRRPEGLPSRRHAVFVSPRPELAYRAGGVTNGRVFRVEISRGGRLVQIPQADARFHPEAGGEGSLARFLLRRLGQGWLDSPAANKREVAVLWTPCLSKDEVEELLRSDPWAALRDEVWQEIHFWEDVRLVPANGPWPYPDGEGFFEAEEWWLRESERR